MIGSFSFIIILSLIIMGILLNGLIVKQTIDYVNLNNKINSLQADTQNKLNELSEKLLQTKTTIEESKEEINLLKASVGEDFSGIVEDSIGAVVTIRTDVSQGTGFIINEQGYIVTNAHVLVGGATIKAITSEQESINAVFIGYDSELDIALLKIPGSHNFLELGNSNKVQIGQKVI